MPRCDWKTRSTDPGLGIGTHGRTGLLLGSVVAEVSEQAKARVTLVQ